MSDEISDEEKRTLWVGGIDSRVDEELLYELMLNAGPIVSVTIPKDKQTLRSKPFAFVLYEYQESLPYAIELFSNTKLFGASLRLQNRATGLGITSYASHNGNSKPANKIPEQENPSEQNMSSPGPALYMPIQRENSSSGFQMSQNGEQDMNIQQDFQELAYAGGNNSPHHLLNLYMNLMNSPNPLFSAHDSSPNPLFSPSDRSSPNQMFSPHGRGSPNQMYSPHGRNSPYQRYSPHERNSPHINNSMQDSRDRRPATIYDRRHRSNQGYQGNSTYNRNEDNNSRGSLNYNRREERSRSDDRHGFREQRQHRR